MKIAIISSSIRNGRLSHRVALFIKGLLISKGIEAELLDLMQYDFPLFHERLYAIDTPAENVIDFAQKFSNADGIIIVSPVYNASFPAALKNVIDLLVSEWVGKPAAVVSVTYGSNAGIATTQHLQALLLKLGARVAAPMYNVLKAGTSFTEEGVPADGNKAEEYSSAMIEELIWIINKSKE